MLPAERKRRIMERLGQEGRVLCTELSTWLDVSEDTIRRDLRELSDSGLVQRVHGGALPRSPAAVDYRVREERDHATKQEIAGAAVSLIRTRQVILMDGGTTNVQVAQQIPHDTAVTVVTNSPPVAIALSAHPSAEVILLGGQLLQESRVAVGAATVEALRTIRADLCLLGVCSLHPEAGITEPHLEEVYVKRAMLAQSAEVAALVSEEKLGTASPYLVAPAAALTYLVTGHGTPETQLASYRTLGVTVLRG